MVNKHSEDSTNEYLFKIVVVGDIGTGKTSIIKRYVHNIFSMHYKSTIGVDFALKVINWDQENVIRLQLWDIAGQERFGNMTRVYYKEAVAAIVVFDVTRESTFEAVQKWKNDIDTKVLLPNGDNIPVILFANKCDLTKEFFYDSKKIIDDFCEKYGFLTWFNTSAKNDIGIDEGINVLVNKILETYMKPKKPQNIVNIVNPAISNITNDNGSNGKCCG